MGSMDLDNLPDEMFEDMLHSAMRQNSNLGIFGPGPFQLDWDAEEEITRPMFQLTAEIKAKRKKDGVCPECGDIKREKAVGVCMDHGKFLG